MTSCTPTISVIVPCHNEEKHILEKLEDIRNLDYPQNYLEVVFADGGSSDRTLALLDERIKDDDYIRVVRCEKKGKINQLNYVLPKVRGDIVVNTDTDARLSTDLLKWIAAEFEADENVWVVGAFSRPQNSILIERYYWSAQNKGRLMESDAGTSSIVIAQCYAFRRGLIKAFPEDVVADDIYISFLANTLGYRTVYSRKAMAVETRSPESYEEFISHKFRKSNAFLRESLRFLYLLPEMTFFCKMMFLTRTTQLLFLPWIFLLWIMLGLTALVYSCFNMVALGIFFIGGLFILTSYIFSRVDLPDGNHQYSLRTIVTGFTVTLCIMLTTGISYPFVQQSSSYRRLASSGKIGQTFAMNFKYAFRLHKPLLILRLACAVCRNAVMGHVALRYVDFAIDFACNLNCQHCFASSLKQNGRRKMTVDDYARVANECMKSGAVNFSFQGGEPLMIPELEAIIAACQPHRNIISVSTNGTLITDERIMELKRWGVDILTISLDSSVPEEHDRFRGSASAHEKTLAGIKIALRNGLRVTLATVVTHQNLREKGISGLLRLAAELKVILYLILPVPAGRWVENDHVALTEEDLGYIDSLTKKSKYIRTDLQANLGGYGCGAAKEILYMTPYGDVLTCPFLHISPGNIFEEPVSDIRQRALGNSWFSDYHPRCLASTDKEFIDSYLSKTFDRDKLPLKWDTVFEKKKDD